MQFLKRVAAVAIGSAALAGENPPQLTKVKIDCRKVEKAGAHCEVKPSPASARPDLFRDVKPKSKTVRL